MRVGDRSAEPDRGRLPAISESAAASPAGANPAGDPARGQASVASRPPAVPIRVQVPALGVDAPVVGVSVQAGGGLAVPDSPQVLGWWRSGAAPGTGVGTVVIDGHVDSAVAGPGALFHLAELQPGQLIWLLTSRGRIGYTVRAIRSYRKSRLPPSVFEPLGSPRLVLITCGGPFNQSTRQYRDNIVAYATPTG